MCPARKLLLPAFGVLGVVGWLTAAELPPVTGTLRQGARLPIPSEIVRGPVILEGQIIHRAVDGSWLRLKLRSDRGTFVYRVTPVDIEKATRGTAAETNSPQSGGTLLGRTVRWSELRPTTDRWLQLEGEITKVGAGGAELEGRFEFADGSRLLRLVAMEIIVQGSDPTPTYRSVSYGPNERQTVDVYLAAATKAPAPVAVFIHGGGWRRGDKADLAGFREILDAGISVVAINYRFCPTTNPDPATPAVAIPLQDAARAVQFIRSQAKEWHLDKGRVGVWGVSAGGCSALWLATHPDQAGRESNDAVSRESTRPFCVAAIFPQTSLDPEEMRGWVGPELEYGPHAFAITGGFDVFLEARPRLTEWINRYSPSALLSADDGPIFLDYRDFSLEPSAPLSAYYTHSPRFGIGFGLKAAGLKVECRLRYAGREDERYSDWKDFLIAKLAGGAIGSVQSSKSSSISR